jgi:hypothetical protein
MTDAIEQLRAARAAADAAQLAYEACVKAWREASFTEQRELGPLMTAALLERNAANVRLSEALATAKKATR